MTEQRTLDPTAPADAGGWLSLDEMLASIETAPDSVVALSITGGGASGAYQAGALSALVAAVRGRAEVSGSPSKATPRIIVGTSAGSLNAFGLLLDYLSPQTPVAEPTVASLWRTIGAENDGASNAAPASCRTRPRGGSATTSTGRTGPRVSAASA